MKEAIKSFFRTGKLLKVNATIITLVPKKANPVSMGDYRPISCCNMKLTIEDCGSLLEKISARIDSWLAKKFSFVRRLQLLSSELIRLKPKLKVSWKLVCAPKTEGGLGLKRLETWSCLWCWRKLLKLRDLARKFLKLQLRDVRNIHLWLNSWHPDGILLDRYGFQTIYDVGSSLEAKVSSVMREENWCWQSARSDNLVLIHSKLVLVNVGEKDTCLECVEERVYSNADTWEALRLKHPKVSWWRLVWLAMAIPKQAFLLWLAIRDSLATERKMLSWGYKGDVSCSFCLIRCIEDRDHLFFQCSFSRRIWKELLHLCRVDNEYVDWEDILKWGLLELMRITMKAVLCRAKLECCCVFSLEVEECH
ncbi:uncharacterized protein LOC132185154 [Corylus avellana]|uniref:uncharacterized protein LOC132185154 n=1 Tax=Corylus avellana TaxID=13451 RepID=UPI00286A4084|nr:uncharacterized protein LOC132185154 [Corylus avellana]